MQMQRPLTQHLHHVPDSTYTIHHIVSINVAHQLWHLFMQSCTKLLTYFLQNASLHGGFRGGFGRSGHLRATNQPGHGRHAFSDALCCTIVTSDRVSAQHVVVSNRDGRLGPSRAQRGLPRGRQNEGLSQTRVTGVKASGCFSEGYCLGQCCVRRASPCKGVRDALWNISPRTFI